MTSGKKAKESKSSSGLQLAGEPDVLSFSMKKTSGKFTAAIKYRERYTDGTEKKFSKTKDFPWGTLGMSILREVVHHTYRDWPS